LKHVQTNFGFHYCVENRQLPLGNIEHSLCTFPITQSLYLSLPCSLCTFHCHTVCVPSLPHSVCTFPTTQSVYLPYQTVSVPSLILTHTHSLCSVYLPYHTVCVPSLPTHDTGALSVYCQIVPWKVLSEQGEKLVSMLDCKGLLSLPVN